MPTYHYVQNQGQLMMQSPKNGHKLQLGQFLEDFEVKYLHIANFSKKQVPFKLKVIFITNFRPKTKKIVRAVFEKNIKVSDFGLIWRLFREYLQIKNFFQKSGSVTFLPLQSPNFMQKIRKILRAVSEKTALPTNQPTNQLLPTTPILQDLAEAGPTKNINTAQNSEIYIMTKIKGQLNMYILELCESSNNVTFKPQYKVIHNGAILT